MYHYLESGLPDVWLRNGYRTVTTPYGKAVAVSGTDALHKAIGRHLLSERPRWTGKEFRFIRKEMDLSQAALARLMGKDAQSVARWEKAASVPLMADRMLRALYKEQVGGRLGLAALVERLNQIEAPPRKLTLEAGTGQRWKSAA